MRHPLGGRGGVAGRPRLKTSLAEMATALRQRLGMAVDRLQALGGGAFNGQQLVAYGLEILGHDVQRLVGQKLMNVRHAATEVVLDRNHGKVAAAGLDHLEHVLETRAGNGLELRMDCAAGQVRPGAGNTLVGDAQRGSSGNNGGSILPAFPPSRPEKPNE